MTDTFQAFLNADARGGVDNGKTSFTVAEAAARLTFDEVGWAGARGLSTTVTYAYRASVDTMPEDTADFSRFNSAQIAQTELALAGWSDVARITFNRVAAGNAGDGAYSNDATILFGNYASGQDTASAFAYLPGSRGATSADGDVWVNITSGSNAAPTSGNYGAMALSHEIGHALGLSHPGDYQSEDAPTYGADADYAEDTRQFTLMSYFGETNSGANFAGRYAAAPLLDDIAAAQLLYGANGATRLSDTVYGFNSNAGRPWFEAANASARLVFAVWDAGGADTFDFSGFGQQQVIDLRPGAFSSVGGLSGNVAIALGATIENGIGGSGTDSIFGNDAANLLRGGAGDDYLDGGKGDDTLYGGAGVAYLLGGDGSDLIQGGSGHDIAAWSGAFDTYQVRYLGLGKVEVISPFERDLAVDVEIFRFADGQINFEHAGNLHDPVFYAVRYRDVFAAGGSAGEHYDAYGWREGRDPNAWFSTTAYLQNNKDVAAAHVNPLVHYELYGWREGRDPSQFFDNEFYLARNPDVAAGDMNPLAHFLQYGQAEGRPTFAAIGDKLLPSSFDPEAYLLANPDVAAAGGDAYAHWSTYGWREDRKPNAVFDTAGYLERYGDIRAAGVDPLAHYATYGWREGRDPSASFDTSTYLQANPDVAAGGVNPLWHYLSYGLLEGRESWSSEDFVI
jgi:Ca2+-binding RTX toxin-like protein